MDMRLELVPLPTTDVDRSKQFYVDRVGFNLDHDIQRALDALTPEYRAAVVLCDIEGLSYEEIAVTLGVKLGTVRSRIHRARAQLRGSLAHRAVGATDEAQRP